LGYEDIKIVRIEFSKRLTTLVRTIPGETHITLTPASAGIRF